MIDVRQIVVGRIKVGLVGQDRALKQVAEEGIGNDEAIATRLLELARQANYVTPSKTEEYKQALLREFKRLRGEEIPCEPGVLEIRVLGQGCPRCDQLMNEVMAVLAALGINADLEHVRDPQEIARIGPVVTPALVINGRIIASGRVPRRAEIARYLQEVAA